MSFPKPVSSFDIHVYFNQNSQQQLNAAQRLNDSLAATFPNLVLYNLIPRPVGPHTTGMFQAVLRTPEEFGRVVPWIMLHRDGLSILIHPHTGDHVADHAEHGIWIGEKLPINLDVLR